jgi:hypothetical protein
LYYPGGFSLHSARITKVCRRVEAFGPAHTSPSCLNRQCEASGCGCGACEDFKGGSTEPDSWRPHCAAALAHHALKEAAQTVTRTKRKNALNRTGKDMSLITLVVTLIVVGVLLWLVNTYIPMDGKIKNILNIAVVVVVVLWLLNVFGVWGHLHDVRVTILMPSLAVPTWSLSSQC